MKVELKEYKRSIPIRQVTCNCGHVITKNNARRCIEDESVEPTTYYDCFYCPDCSVHYSYDDKNLKGFTAEDFWE